MLNKKQKISFIVIFLIFAAVVLTIVLSLKEDDIYEKIEDNNKLETNSQSLNSSLNQSTNQPVIHSTNYSVAQLKIDTENESCLKCHLNVSGFSVSHNPEKIGCASCHLGNVKAKEKNAAHKGMVAIPGNLSTAKQTCGTTACHPGIAERVDSSIMSTMSGVISVDKFVFGEIISPNGKFHAEKLGNSAADSHLKHLCASCHLGAEKKEFGEIVELSRGGGCNACHLNYNQQAKDELARMKSNKKSKHEEYINKFHPSLSLNVTNNHCFGCHSRSGRISTNYEGWHETSLEPKEVKGKKGFRFLQDGRVFEKVKSDVHYKAGLSCIDCHTSYEIMGDGISHQHKEEQVTVQCSDCHSKKHLTMELKQFDYESKKIAEIKKYNVSNRKFIKIKKSGRPLVNTIVKENGEAKLIGKINGKTYPLIPPSSVCTEAESHKNVSCNSCHTAWAPQCVGCHTEYDTKRKGFDLLHHKSTKGAWVEYVGEFFAEQPTLGIVENMESKKIEPFIPGMIMTLDKNNYTKKKEKPIFKRLFAPSVPHTIQKEGRSCESCHNNSLALGYGRGEVKYEIVNGKGKWKFIPAYDKYEADNLPQDAWIGFLTEPKKNIGTRTNVRPFNLTEQKKILTVGACLTCHKPDSDIMKNALKNFNGTLENLSEKCILPDW